jgi:hypothetical protein
MDEEAARAFMAYLRGRPDAPDKTDIMRELKAISESLRPEP